MERKGLWKGGKETKRKSEGGREGREETEWWKGGKETKRKSEGGREGTERENGMVEGRGEMGEKKRIFELIGLN